MSTVLTLADFLLARIAEDEAVARGLLAAERRSQFRHVGPSMETWSNPDYLEEGISVSPERAVAECEAKRRILDLHRSGEAWCDHCSGWYGDDPAADCPTLRLLAVPYANHPDFDPSWRVGGADQ